MEFREQRIATLAATLKASGIAKSDAQAKMMAEDMVSVEEHVQKSYEEKNARANEYLQTAKNLGVPRQVRVEPVNVIKPDVRPEGSRMVEPIPTITPTVQKSDLPPVHTDVNFGGKTLNQAFDHDTHNPALEEIKAKVSAGGVSEFKDLDEEDDLGEGDVLEDSVDYVDQGVRDVKQENVLEDDVDYISQSVEDTKKEVVMQDVDDIIEAPEEPKIMDTRKRVSDVPAESPKLDAQKLVELMEEDGELEEHTREIKEKPKNVKPKEDYVENSVDLSDMFDFNKR